jgi:hypothetical protein
MEVLYCASAAFPALVIVAVEELGVRRLDRPFLQSVLGRVTLRHGIILALDGLVILVAAFAEPVLGWLLSRERAQLQDTHLKYHPAGKYEPPNGHTIPTRINVNTTGW